MLYLINIHWQRRDPQPDQVNIGTTTQAEFASSLNAAITKAKTKFLRHYGMHRAITRTEEAQDPAGIFKR